ncbi:MAG: hypothetical protein M1820_010544 [Bogoriella megaspora]|nr:MAG: hypothetical protein M1820_010544 [Bogoriella megaspora]
MPPPQAIPARTIGSASFDPESFTEAWKEGQYGPPTDNDLRGAIIKAFGLKETDEYVYHAIASVTLSQVQVAINHGSEGGLHAWYKEEDGKLIPPPPPADINAYTSIFSSTTSTPKALTGFASNAKKNSLRASIATHLQSNLLLPHPSTTSLTLPSKLKTPHTNPYYDIWAWTCRTLEWAGPTPSTVHTHQSHHILPILYHHFSCICPSYDALSLLSQLSTLHKPTPRSILEIGSGNGYWAFLLRRLGITVHAVDNGASAWRTMWIADTIYTDGARYLKEHNGGRDAVLLLVYPQVGADFTGKMLRAYEGDTIVVAGTQNRNGFTGFRGEVVSEWMEREMSGWRRVVQVPLPSFAGKDEALFVFMKGGVDGGSEGKSKESGIRES